MFEASLICPILSFSIHSSIFSPSSSTTSQTTVSLPFTSPAGFMFFQCFQLCSNLCQYCLLCSPSDHPNNLLVVYQPGNPPLRYSLLFSASSCYLTSLLFLLYSSSNSFSRSLVFSKFSLLSQVSSLAMNPFHCTKNLSLPHTLLLFRIFSISHSSSPFTITGHGASFLWPSIWLMYHFILLTFTTRCILIVVSKSNSTTLLEIIALIL